MVTAHLDNPKRATLGDTGLSLASEWWVGEAAAILLFELGRLTMAREVESTNCPFPGSELHL